MLLIFLALFSQATRAEYRAFELRIINLQSGAERTVLSNFDPDQYRFLYPVLAEEEIKMVNTWKCKGDTSKKPICPNPKAETSTLPKSEPAP